jgi:uncharacterized membrane protein
MSIYLTIACSVLFPFLALYLEKKQLVPSFFSAVVMCYAFGIIIGNIAPQLVDEKIAEQVAGAGMIIALPMLLFGSNIQANWKLAGPGLLSYILCAVAGLLGTALAAYIFKDIQADGWKIAGMLTGLYTGGTPNMQSIGIAVDAPADYVVLLQAADIVGGGVYLLLMMTVIQQVLGYFLPSFKHDTPEETSEEVATANVPTSKRWWLLPTLISLAVGAASAGITKLIAGDLSDTTLLILVLTSISVLLSFFRKISALPGSFRQGEYFLLIFCVALGLLANFQKLIEEGLPLLTFSLLALSATILLHWLFAWIFKVDRDTVIVSSTAALYGPVFIAQVTTAIHNRKLLAPGIALSLLGLAVGNYLGIGVAYLAKWLLGG